MTQEALQRFKSNPEKLWKLLFNQHPAGCAVVGLDGTFREVNQSLCNMLGYTSFELCQKRYQDITVTEDLEADSRTLEEVRSGRLDTYTMSKRYITKTGEIIWIRLTVEPYKESEEVFFYVSHIHALSPSEETFAAAIHGQTQVLVKVLEILESSNEHHQEDANTRQSKGPVLDFMRDHAQWLAPILISIIIGGITLWIESIVARVIEAGK